MEWQMTEVGARLIERIPNQILISIDLKRRAFWCRTALLWRSLVKLKPHWIPSLNPEDSIPRLIPLRIANPIKWISSTSPGSGWIDFKKLCHKPTTESVRLWCFCYENGIFSSCWHSDLFNPSTSWFNCNAAPPPPPTHTHTHNGVGDHDDDGDGGDHDGDDQRTWAIYIYV